MTEQTSNNSSKAITKLKELVEAPHFTEKQIEEIKAIIRTEL
jgi:predicted Zn-dependent peptidase|tara:strand:+ start:1714 stop:1839 length:126 start_codon:yes stop_codon:yes gene_type:complete